MVGNLFAGLNFADKIFSSCKQFGKFCALDFFVGSRGFDGLNFFITGRNFRLNILRHEIADVVHKVAFDVAANVIKARNDVVFGFELFSLALASVIFALDY